MTGKGEGDFTTEDTEKEEKSRMGFVKKKIRMKHRDHGGQRKRERSRD